MYQSKLVMMTLISKYLTWNLKEQKCDNFRSDNSEDCQLSNPIVMQHYK